MGLRWVLGWLVAISLAFATVLGCADELVERELCDDLADELCARWFECRPQESQGLWTDMDGCIASVRATCSSSERLASCDLGDAELRECESDVDDSECGALPMTCRDIVDCP